MNGCIITKGAMDWQVYQRNENGNINIELEGTWEFEKECIVQVRITRESTSAAVRAHLNWQDAEINKNNTWKIVMKNVPCGGPYRIETRLKDIIFCETVHNIYVGDLWVIAGQSNASGIGRGEIEDLPEFGVHVFRNEEKWALAMHPLNDATRTAHPVNREGGPQHSPFLIFGKRIKNESGVPVGFIQTSLGGSPLSAWNPGDGEAVLYKNMIHCINLAGGKIKGILWYQGCSDTDKTQAETYFPRFENFVKQTRKDLDTPDLPFITVQLNRFTTEQDAFPVYWSVVREQQRQISHKVSRVYMVVAIDLPLSDQVHNSVAGNIVLGNRLADCALTEIYKTKSTYKSPEIKSAVLSRDKLSITLEFENVESALFPINDSCGMEKSFTIEDEKGLIELKEVRIEGSNKIVIRLSKPPCNNVYIHGLYGVNPQANIYDFEPLRPMMTFYKFPVEN